MARPRLSPRTQAPSANINVKYAFLLSLLKADSDGPKADSDGPAANDCIVSLVILWLGSRFGSGPHTAHVARPRARPSPEHRPACCFRRARSANRFGTDNSISVAASHQRPPCESALCHFSANCYFSLFARPQRLARTNGPKSHLKRAAIESPGGISVAKSRTVGLNSVSLRRRGRRLNLPGWGAGIRTPEWRYQKPLPYHLATPQCRERAESYAIRARNATGDNRPVLSRFCPETRGRKILRPQRQSLIAPRNESRYSPASVGV